MVIIRMISFLRVGNKESKNRGHCNFVRLSEYNPDTIDRVQQSRIYVVIDLLPLKYEFEIFFEFLFFECGCSYLRWGKSTEENFQKLLEQCDKYFSRFLIRRYPKFRIYCRFVCSITSSAPYANRRMRTSTYLEVYIRWSSLSSNFLNFYKIHIQYFN